MANRTYKQIVLDGPRNAVIKLTGILDTSDVYWKPATTLSDFTNNEPRLNFVGFRVDHIEFAIGNGIEMLVEWGGNVGGPVTPQMIMPLSGRGRIDGSSHAGWQPDRTLPGYDGSINVKSTGWMTGIQNFTLTLEMVKLYTV